MALLEDGLSGSTKSILVILGVALAAPIVLTRRGFHFPPPG